MENEITDQEIREGDDALNDEPLEAVTEEAQEGGHEHDGPQGEVHEGDAGAPPEGLAHVGGHREVVELQLRYAHHRLQLRRVGREVEVGPRERLYPRRRHQHHPLPRLPRHVSRATSPTDPIENETDKNKILGFLGLGGRGPMWSGVE